jgi:hypothetical protein
MELENTVTQNGAGAESETLKRKPDEKQPWEYFFGEQRIEDYASKSTDCHLICSDGFVPAHSLVLQVVSPFFDAIFTAQGCPCLAHRPITMQDYNVSDVRKLIELIYTGTVTLKTDEQVNTIKDMIKSFNILSCATLESTTETIKPSRGRPASSDDKNALFYPFDKRKTIKENLGLIKAKPVVNVFRTDPTKVNLKSSPKKDTFYRPRVEPNGQKSESDSDAEERKISASREWFLQEAKKCQYCGQDCKTAAAASTCLTGHGRLRCYFCFKVVKNTEKLFQHFNDKHKKAGRENCLLCPLCETIVPFKSVSCHVISLHLADNKNPPNRGNIRSAGTVGRPPLAAQQLAKTNATTSATATSSSNDKTTFKRPAEPVGEEVKKKKYVVGDLDVSFKRKSICGKVRVFNIVKSRRNGDVTTVTI